MAKEEDVEVKSDLSNEIRAYALKNAVEFGRADAGKILPKLFQHGLMPENAGELMGEVRAIAKEVNGLMEGERDRLFHEFQKYIKVREAEEKGLPDLPNARQGKVVVRIAPFPSGALHIGNAKTFILNSLYAEKYQGRVVLVMDDTIGSEKKPLEKDAYALIESGLKWLGIKYDEIFYKSDRLEIYYKYGKELLKKGGAYICYCSREEVTQNRAAGKDCGCRLFPEKIQLQRWEEMFEMDEGHATMRIKTGMQHQNPAFRDRILFKISDREHPRVGKKYRVWPTLEMTWAIDDHDLGITHVIRGSDLMIESDMERFIWKIFKWKGPEIIHTGLVNLEGAGISKSKSRGEVKKGEFSGWDDPRTWSLQSLKRRGIKSEALKSFVEEIGLNKQDITIPIDDLYSHNRKLIDASSDRYSFVKSPVLLKVLDIPKGVDFVNLPVHPDRKDVRQIRIKDIYISREDFEALRGREARLIHLFNVLIARKKGEDSKYSSMSNKKLPRINWVSDNINARVLMPDGKKVEGVVESSASGLKPGSVVQFERFGFVRFEGVKDGMHEFLFSHK
jgi:glutamyl-tRNA synthetase